MTDQTPKRITIDAPSEATILAARHLDATEGRAQVGSTVDTSTRSAITTVLRYIAKAHNSPAAIPTHEVSRYDQLSPLARALVDDYDALDLAKMLVAAQNDIASCKTQQWPQRLARAERERDLARQHAAAIAAQRDRLRQRMNNLADRWERDAPPPGNRPLTELREEISCDPFDPEGAMTVQEYTERGRHLWAFRCWGTDTCDGWLGLGHHTQTSALAERERHVAEAHTAPAPAATAWTPPPPGDTREQLPDHLLDLIRGSLPDYTSTACVTAYALAVAVHWSHPRRAELGQWAHRMHDRCRKNQKFTGQFCTCGCHDTEQTATPPTATDTQEQP